MCILYMLPSTRPARPHHRCPAPPGARPGPCLRLPLPHGAPLGFTPAFAEPYVLQLEDKSKAIAAPAVTKGQDAAADVLAKVDGQVRLGAH